MFASNCYRSGRFFWTIHKTTHKRMSVDEKDTPLIPLLRDPEITPNTDKVLDEGEIEQTVYRMLAHAKAVTDPRDTTSSTIKIYETNVYFQMNDDDDPNKELLPHEIAEIRTMMRRTYLESNALGKYESNICLIWAVLLFLVLTTFLLFVLVISKKSCAPCWNGSRSQGSAGNLLLLRRMKRKHLRRVPQSVRETSNWKSTCLFARLYNAIEDIFTVAERMS